MISCSSASELRRCRPLLGTFVEITARGATPATLAAGIESAFSAVARVQSLMSYHDASSELSLLNRQASLGAVRVEAWTQQVLARVQRIHAASGGCFDPVVAPHLERTGYLPSVRGAPRASPHARFTDVILLAGNRVRFARPLRLDLGGIAKGFAVDRAIDALRAAGVPAALVNAGGDLRAFGGHAWPMTVRDPALPGQMRSFGTLRDGALATSAIYFSERRTSTGRRTSAMVDPRSHRPWLARASVSVLAPEAATADALTKVLALQGPIRAGKLFETFEAEGWWLAASGQFHSTPEFACGAA